MKNITIRLADVAKTLIKIGYEGEQNHTRVIFYCAQVFDEYPNAVATMAIKPGAGEAYPQSVTKDGSMIVWDVTAANVAGTSGGTYQFTFTDGEEIMKSGIGQFSVLNSIIGDGEPPDPIADWIASTENMYAKKTNAVFDGTLSHGRRPSTTSGEYSVTLGSNNTSSGMYAVAEGRSNTASGAASHAENQGNTASGQYSHAGGYGSVASGARSIAHGNYTTANHRSQAVFGEFNVADPSTAATTARGNFVEIIGNGTSTGARSNARTLDWDGNEALQGSITLGKGTADEVTLTAAQLKQLIALLS